MKRKIITDNTSERITIRWDNTRFGLTRQDISLMDKNQNTIVDLILLNPREAQAIADFITEHNIQYRIEKEAIELARRGDR